MAKKPDMGWMYEGVKSDAHREDYLLGKRVDKNFEKYSDAVVSDKPDVLDSVVRSRVVGGSSSLTSSTGMAVGKTSSLPVNIIRSDDPFVALKVKEESRRREMMDNPLTKLRFQKMIKEMMDKKEKKASKKAKKKEKKKERKRKESESESSEDERSKKKSKRDHSPEKRRERRDSDRQEKRRRRDSTDDERHRRADGRKGRDCSGDDRRGKSRRSPEEERGHERRRGSSGDRRSRRRRSSDVEERVSRSDSSRKHRDSGAEEKKVKREMRSRSRSEDRSKRDGSRSHETESERKGRNFDSHIPAHLLQEGSSGDEGDRKTSFDKEERAAKAKYEGYGLVGVKKKDPRDDEGPSENPYQLKRLPTVVVSEKKERKRPLTDEEKAQRLRDMQDNAKWRDETRRSNIQKDREDDDAEEKEADGRPASFVRPMLSSIVDDSMEARLKTKKRSLQTGPGYMDKL